MFVGGIFCAQYTMSSFPYEQTQTPPPAAARRPTGAHPTASAPSQIEPDITRPQFDWYRRSPVKAVGAMSPASGEKVEGYATEGYATEGYGDGGSLWMIILFIVIVIIGMGVAVYMAYRREKTLDSLPPAERAAVMVAEQQSRTAEIQAKEQRMEVDALASIFR